MEHTGNPSDEKSRGYKEPFKLPAADDDAPFLSGGPIIGWEFWEQVYFRDGRTVDARGITNEPGSDGPRKARCAAHDALYDQAISQGIPFIQKLGDCNYAINREDLASGTFYRWSGPSAIREPGGGP